MVGPFGLHPNKTMQSRALSLAEALVKRGHVVRIIMPPWQTPDEADKSWQDGGVEMRYVSLKGGMPFTVWRMFREAIAWKPDVIHSFKPKAYSGLVAWLLWQFKRHKLRLVTDTDDWEGWDSHLTVAGTILHRIRRCKSIFLHGRSNGAWHIVTRLPLPVVNWKRWH